MERISEINLLHSHFVIGAHSKINKSLNHSKGLYDWLKHKDEDWGMEAFRTNRTQYVGFLHIVDMTILDLVLKDLINIYKKAFPYSEKQDFIDYVFGYTLYDLHRFNTRDYRFLGSPYIDSPFEYYYCHDEIGELIDVAIPTGTSINHYKQYYKKVISLIKEVSWNQEFRSEQVEQRHDTSSLKKKGKPLSSVPKWATVFYYADHKKLTPESSHKKERMILFMERHNIETSFKYFKSSYHESSRKLIQKRYPIQKLKSLLPFLEHHYPETVKTVESDIEVLEIENSNNY